MFRSAIQPILAARRPLLAATLLLVILTGSALAEDKDEGPWTSGDFGALAFREIGPAIASGRIGDIAVDPRDNSHWYVASAAATSGRPTTRASPSSPSSTTRAATPSAAWPSTPPTPTSSGWARGENNSQRSVSYGDGIYKSLDGGKSWQNMGLERVSCTSARSSCTPPTATWSTWRPWAPVGPGRRPRPVQDHRRRHDLDPRPRHQREHRRGGPGDGPARPRRALCGQLPAAAPHLDPDQRRPRAAASTRPPTAAKPGARSTRACPAATRAASDWPSRPEASRHHLRHRRGRGRQGRLLPLDTDGGENWSRMSDYVSGSPQYYNEIYVDPTTRAALQPGHLPHRTEDGGKTWSRVQLRGQARG
jgi:hypothetical protein